jgi:alcohol dehydrogenase (cytochrome c)
MPPLVFEDMVIIGPAGSENNVQGWIGAFRLKDGTQVWRFNTIPRPGEPGAETWRNAPGVPVGGGGVWTAPTLDVARGELYVAVTNPAPDLPAALRPGENLYTNSVIALDVRTGALRWYHQMVPSDFHDWDLTQATPLIRVKRDGHDREAVVTVGKDGILRTLDRQTHERFYETPVTTQENVDLPLTREGVRVCPGVLGGVEWNGPAYHPGTGLLFTPAVDWCTTFSVADSVRFVPGGLYVGGDIKFDSTSQGWLTAVDASTGKVRWRYRSERPMVAAVTTTAGGLVFTGENTGDFLALDAATGRELYRFNTGGGMGGGIISYAVKGRQYIAAASGRSGFWFGQTGAPTLFVFALPSGGR